MDHRAAGPEAASPQWRVEQALPSFCQINPPEGQWAGLTGTLRKGGFQLLNLNLLADAVHGNAAALVAGHAVEALDGLADGLLAEPECLMVHG